MYYFLGKDTYYVKKLFQVENINQSDFSESPYIDIDSLSEQLTPHTKKFSVLSVNMRSINVKFDKLLTLITYLNENNFMFSAICIHPGIMAKTRARYLSLLNTWL